MKRRLVSLAVVTCVLGAIPAAWSPGAAGAAVTAASAVPSVTINDPAGDVALAAGDITSASAGADATSLVFTVRVAAAVDPATDPNWAGQTGPFWGIDSNFDGKLDYLAIIVWNKPSHALISALFDATGNNLLCVGTATWTAGLFRATLGSECPHIPSFRWGVGFLYDTTPNGPANDSQADFAPNAGWAPPTPLHRTGYWMLGGDGKSYGFGNAPDFSSSVPYASSMSPRSDGTGLTIVDRTGAVFAYGVAPYRGGKPALRAGEIVSAVSTTPSGNGYWLFTNRGRAFAYGDAHLYGDLANVALQGPVIASVATPSGHGYYMVGSDGGIFAFGDARFRGSMGATRLNRPVVGMAPTPDNRGYWLVASDGGVFAFGDAAFRGSMANTQLNKPINGLVAFGNGYLMVASDGGVFDFSNKPFLGSLSGQALSAPIIGIAAFTT